MLSRTAISGPWRGSRILWGFAGADQLVAEIAAGIVDGGDLGVLAEGVVDLQVARRDLGSQRIERDQLLAGERVHRRDEIGEVVLDDEILAFLLEGLDRAGRLVADGALGDSRQLLPVKSGFCSEPDNANSLRMMLWFRTNQEWS